MVTNFINKIGEIGRLTFTCRLAFDNGSKYRNADDGRVKRAMNWLTSCSNLVRFGAVTLEFTKLILCTAGVDQQQHWR